MRLALVALFLFGVFCIPSHAFLPDDVELSSQMRKHFGALSSWEAEMSFPDHPGVSVHLWYARGKWRQQWKSGDKAEAVGNGDNVVSACTAEGFALSPLFVWMVPNPVQSWKEWGVDNATRSYGFCGDAPCLSFGADPLDEDMPVIHLNNEDFAPLLIRYRSGSGLTSVVFSEYKAVGGFQMPQKVVLTMNGESLEGSVKWIGVNRADAESLYARDSLDGQPCATPSAPFGLLRDTFRYPAAR